MSWALYEIRSAQEKKEFSYLYLGISKFPYQVMRTVLLDWFNIGLIVLFKNKHINFINLLFKSLFSIGQFQKISIHHDGQLFGIPRARWGSLNWNSEGMGEYLHLEFWRLKMIILWTSPVRKQSTTEQRDTDVTKVKDTGEESIDLARKPIKLGLYIKFMNFLMMNIRLIKYEQIGVRVNFGAFLNPGVQLAKCDPSLLWQRAPFWNMIEVGLGVTADPAGSNSIWRMCQSTQSPLIVISSERTNLYHTIFLF